MLVRFWGTRGSIPVALTAIAVKAKLVAALVQAAGRTLDTPEKARAFVDRELDFAVSQTFGGNSSCVEIDTGGADYVLCDLGSGARAFGNHVLATRGPAGNTFHVLMSHVHWDHIMGFPFFMPAYIPGNRVRITSAAGAEPGHAERRRAVNVTPRRVRISESTMMGFSLSICPGSSALARPRETPAPESARACEPGAHGTILESPRGRSPAMVGTEWLCGGGTGIGRRDSGGGSS